MKIICEGLDLSDAVLKVVKACSTRTTNPILECIKISARNDGLTLLSTDGEIAIQKKINAEVLEEGEIAVPGKYFSDFIKKLENVQITLSSENDTLTIRYADAESVLQLLNVNDFPSIDMQINENQFTMAQKDLKELILKTTFCCAQDDSRPVLKGCLIEAADGVVICTALDGYRMAVCKRNVISMNTPLSIICPARTLNEIARMLTGEGEEIVLYVQKGMLLVSIDDTVLTSRLYDGEFVNRNNIIPKAFSSEIVVDCTALRESVERASILARTDKNSVISFDIRDGVANVNSNTSIGRVNESVKIMLDGKDVNISLNSKYVSECMNAVPEEKTRIGFNGAVAPCVITPVMGDAYLYLLLPVRTNG